MSTENYIVEEIDYTVLCDDGEVVYIYAPNKTMALIDAIERGYKPVGEHGITDTPE